MFHYREKAGLEVDAIVQANDGRWAAFVVKLGEGRVDKRARNLLKLAKRVNPRGVGHSPVGSVHDPDRTENLKSLRGPDRDWMPGSSPLLTG